VSVNSVPNWSLNALRMLLKRSSSGSGSGIKAVQTLSRLNRAHPQKHDCFVLDFQNNSEAITFAFQDYYRTTLLADETDPNKLHDLKAALDSAQVYSPDQVQQVVELFLSGADRDKLDPILDACVAVYVHRLDEDGQVDFKGKAKVFCRTYGFLSSVISYSNVEWEKLSILLNLLTPKLPAPQEGVLCDLPHHRRAFECGPRGASSAPRRYAPSCRPMSEMSVPTRRSRKDGADSARAISDSTSRRSSESAQASARNAAGSDTGRACAAWHNNSRRCHRSVVRSLLLLQFLSQPQLPASTVPRPLEDRSTPTHFLSVASQFQTTVIGAEFSSSALRFTRKRRPSCVTTYWSRSRNDALRPLSKSARGVPVSNAEPSIFTSAAISFPSGAR
jgi:hypothetical protein